jgi:hypothetical protein
MRRCFVGLVLALAVLFANAQTSTALGHNIVVRVVDASTDQPLSGITVNLRLGQYPGRKTLQQTTDSRGAAYFYVQPPLPDGVSVDAFSVRYHEIHADPEINFLPHEITVPVRRLSLMESLHFLFAGD